MVNLDMSKYSIITLDEVHSTNSYALENVRFFDDKTVVYTTRQTAGRGRYKRRWICDDTENLYMSIILKPDSDFFPYTNLTQYLSVIVSGCLEDEFDLKPEIKWPNDILIDGYKISGILAESYMQNNQIKAVILGLGLNVNLQKQTAERINQKATSLSILKNKNFDVEKIMKLICGKFFEAYADFEKEGFSVIKEDYIKKCGFLGKNITIKEEDIQKSYYAKAIDDEGLLIVEDEFGKECKIITGDVLC